MRFRRMSCGCWCARENMNETEKSVFRSTHRELKLLQMEDSFAVKALIFRHKELELRKYRVCNQCRRVDFSPDGVAVPRACSNLMVAGA